MATAPSPLSHTLLCPLVSTPASLVHPCLSLSLSLSHTLTLSFSPHLHNSHTLLPFYLLPLSPFIPCSLSSLSHSLILPTSLCPPFCLLLHPRRIVFFFAGLIFPGPLSQWASSSLSSSGSSASAVRLRFPTGAHPLNSHSFVTVPDCRCDG